MLMRRREHGRDSKMPCESCAVQFSMFKRKRVCSECERCYCSSCLRRGGGAMCAPCRVLSTRPLSRTNVAHLRVRDLQCFLQRQNVSTRGCVEKEELVSLCVSHVNSAAYRRRGARGSPGAFSSLKGLTSNINEFLTSAFDLRPAAHPAPAPPPPPPPRQPPAAHPAPASHTCYNNTTAGAPPRRAPATSGGECGGAGGAASPGVVDTADCYEIEDLDENGWELVRAPAAPLPNDSDVLLSTTEDSEPLWESVRERDRESTAERDPAPGRDPPPVRDTSPEREPECSQHNGPEPAGGVARAASELELQPPRADGDSASLQDLPRLDNDSPSHVTLEQFAEAGALAALSVRQLKELLARNRVEYRGCVERAELLERARALWRDHRLQRAELESLPLEECCKICMAAPLECVLLECGHIAACTACARQLAECPICRRYVVRAVRFFRS